MTDRGVQAQAVVGRMADAGVVSAKQGPGLSSEKYEAADQSHNSYSLCAGRETRQTPKRISSSDNRGIV
jgi:hypothetical protein